MNSIRTWLILIASVAIVSDAKLYLFRVPQFLQTLSPYEFNVTKDGSFSDPAGASVTFFVKPKGGSFGRKKREAFPHNETSSEKQSLEERDGKVLFTPARWDWSPTSGAAVTAGAMSALSSLIWTVIKKSKDAREAGITADTISSLPMNSFGNPHGSQYAPSPYYPSYESSYPTPPKGKPPKIFKGINPMKGLKAIQDEALKGINKLQNQLNKVKPTMTKPFKGKKQKQKPSYYPYYPPAMSSVSYYPTDPQSSYPAPQPNYPAPPPSYPAPQPSYPAPPPSYPAPQPSYPAPQPSYPAPQPSYPAPQPSYPAPQPSYPAPPPSYPAPQPSYPAPPPSYPAPASSYPQPDPVYPREEAPTYGVPPTPGPYVPPPPPEVAYEPPQVDPAPTYAPPPNQAPTTTPVYRLPPPTPAVTPVPIQYESFIPIAPSPPKARQFLPPIENPLMNGPPPMGPGDSAIIPSPIDPSPFEPSDDEAAGLWGRPSEEVMSWLSPEFRTSNANETVSSTSKTTGAPKELDDTLSTSVVAVTQEAIAYDSSSTTTPAPSQSKS